MKRLLPFSIIITTALAALLVIVVQPQQTAVQKKRLKDMRQFLLAQTDPLADCTIYMYENPEYYSACVGWQSDNSRNPSFNADTSGSSERGNDANATGQQHLELECLNIFDQSPFGAVRSKEGLPNFTRLLVNQICSSVNNAITGKYGSSDLEQANRALSKERDFALVNTPAPQNQTIENYITQVNAYLKEVRNIMKEFENFTTTAPYLINPLPLITGENNSLHQKLVAVIEKYAKKPETPAPQENKTTETLTPALVAPAPAQPTAPENVVVRAINKFIRILKENLLGAIRKLNPQRRIFNAGMRNPKIISNKTLRQYYHNLRLKCTAEKC